MQQLAGFCDPGHQERGGLEIPIRIGTVRVSEIGAKRYDMAIDGITIVLTLLERPDSKRMSQIMDARPALAWSTSQSNGAGELEESGDHGIVGWRLAWVGIKQRTVLRETCEQPDIRRGPAMSPCAEGASGSSGIWSDE
jgi:hypothetical protein